MLNNYIVIHLTTGLLLINLQVIQSLFCYSCFNTPNNVYPNALPCPRQRVPGVVDFALMNVIKCDDLQNSCVMYTERYGNVESPVSAGCSWRRIAFEKKTSYVRNCHNGRCENYCATDYCRYKWPWYLNINYA